MRKLEFLFLIIKGIKIKSSIVSALPFDLNEFFSNPNNKSPEELLKMIENYQYEFPNYDWEVDTGKSLMFDIPNDQMMIKSIDAGLFYKDIKEETYCNYSYSSSYKKHYMLCHAVIKNYSKRNTAKTYYFYIDFGINQKPVCSIGYEITSNSVFEVRLYNDNGEKAELLGELRFNKFATEKELPFEGNVKRKYFSFDNVSCHYTLSFDKIKIYSEKPTKLE